VAGRGDLSPALGKCRLQGPGWIAWTRMIAGVVPPGACLWGNAGTKPVPEYREGGWGRRSCCDTRGVVGLAGPVDPLNRLVSAGVPLVVWGVVSASGRAS
jgi:hypothetical protein